MTSRRFVGILLGLVAGTAPAFSQTLTANTTSNNGGSSAWGMFMDFSSAPGTSLTVTSLTTASTAAANANFTLTVYTRTGTALGGPLTSGPGSSSAGWTMLGLATATQGATASGISLPIDIPDINVPDGQLVGVALVFTAAGPRYLGSGSPALTTFTDGTFSLTTGDSRTAPFTASGSFFSSRAMTGSIDYVVTPAPEPGSVLALGSLGMAGAWRGRRLLARRKI